jgi:hypothetical protein
MRINIFEFEDLRGFPEVIRNGMTDYLRFVLTAFKVYNPVVPKITELIKKTKHNCIVDMCSGGGGAIEAIHQLLLKYSPDLRIILTDLYPNIGTFAMIKERSAGQISYLQQPIDATNIPSDIKGVRTMFSAFHHFDPIKAKKILKNAVSRNEPIAIFDGGEKNLFMILFLFVFHPICFFFLTPFIRPFSISRLFFTYFIPIIPFCTIWDGTVSIMRLYSLEKICAIANEAGENNYSWESGTVKGRAGVNIIFLIGIPNV